jgi:2-aminobenzoate-CoA ligase
MDSFVRDRLPPKEIWPDIDFFGLPELAYPEKLNCADALLDEMIEAGFGDRPVLHFHGTSWTYKALGQRAARIAAVLVEDLGLQAGNRVLLRGANTPMLVAAWFGVVKAGGIAVTTMPMLRAKELELVIERAEIAHALCEASLAEELAIAGDNGSFLRHVMHFTGSGDGANDGAASLETAMYSKQGAFRSVETRADDPVMIAFTSGTTGGSKGTVHFHRDVLAICDTFARHVLNVTPDDIFIGSPPIAFTFGFGALVAFPMRVGASTVMVDKFGPTTLLETIEAMGCTCVFTAPTAYRTMIEQLDGYNLGSLRACVSAGEHLPKKIWDEWYEATGLKLFDGIGATEMLHIFISAAEADIRPGATGKPVPGYQARIVDGDGAPVPTGEQGWLAVKGPTGCRYLDDETRQRTYVQNGWNITGDIYRQDEDGYFWFVARGDDMIISAGYNIAGPEVEACLLEHPDVLECAVIGVPDSERGNIVKAFVVPKPGVSTSPNLILDLQNFVKRKIAPYKYPRAIEFREELPKTQTGKLQRFRLRECKSVRQASTGDAA